VVYQSPDIEDKERINVLFLGIDQRPGESTDCRTDTMILTSIDPKDMSVSILSIPRDLWISIPHHKHPEGKINTAHYWGEIEDYPGGGPALAKKTVQRNFGVRVHYYARLNFTGFERIIDRIGGIYVDVPYVLDDPEYPNGSYGTEHLHIDAGRQHFNGEMALKYARTRRGGGDGDFTRMKRQQQVMLAVRDRVLSLPNLPQLVVQLPQMYREMGDSLETDIPLELMFTLAKWAQQVESEDIQTATISREMTRDWKTPDGQAILIYDRDKARPIVEALFSDPTPEAVAIETSQVVAATVVSFLEMQGIDVVKYDNADRADYEYTVVKVYEDKAFTIHWLTNWLIDLGFSEPNIKPESVESDIDISIVIGQDFPVDKIK
jgi:LCP family protein required for cell wall assembly